MCLWKRVRTYLFLPFVTTLVRQPHYAGGRCADKLEEYTAVLENKVSLDSVAGTYCSVLPSNVETILTLKAYGTYLLARIFKEKQNEQEKCDSAYGGFVLSHLAMCGKLFQQSLCVAPLLSYCRIPSYRLGWRVPFGHHTLILVEP